MEFVDASLLTGAEAGVEARIALIRAAAFSSPLRAAMVHLISLTTKSAFGFIEESIFEAMREMKEETSLGEMLDICFINHQKFEYLFTPKIEDSDL